MISRRLWHVRLKLARMHNGLPAILYCGASLARLPAAAEPLSAGGTEVIADY